MKKKLRISIYGLAIALFSVTGSYGQIKGDPEMKGKPEQLTVPKSSSKLSPALNNLMEKPQLGLQKNAKKGSSISGLQNYLQMKGDKVLVDFSVKDNVATTQSELKKLGVTITGIYGRVISGYVPVSMLPLLEKASSVRFVKPAYKPRRQSFNAKYLQQDGSHLSTPPAPTFTTVISQGDTAQYSYVARQRAHVNGKDVKVGILSDSYNNLGTADVGVLHGELPGFTNPFGFKKPVEVLSDLDSGGTDEGRAMAEIIHDVAPGSPLAFYTADNGEADFAAGIQKLADKGCKVIADDVIYLDEPFFQDGIIAQSVDAAKKKGVTYFSSAGNQSIRSYASPYRPTNVEYFGPGFGTAHNFSAPGDQPRFAQPIYIPSGGVIVLSLQWDQSSYSASGVGPTTDMDIYLTDIFGNIVAAGATDNIGSGEPVELMGYYNNTNSPTFYLTIVKYVGKDPERLKYILYDDALFYLTKIPIPGILSPTLVGHAKAEGAIATGAAFYVDTHAYGRDTAAVEWFSAEGGVPNYYDIQGNRIAPLVRKKPNIVAPDGVNTSFFDPFGNGDIHEDTDSFPNFFGTSAAAPHAAGVAALMIQAEKLNNITPEQIKGVLQATASDMDDIHTDGFDKGFDFNTGYGFINAANAVDKVKFPNNYISELKLAPICSDDPSKIRNWKITNPNPFAMEVSWFLQGSDQHGELLVEPGDATFSTNTLIKNGIVKGSIAFLTWKDNFGFPRFNIAFSTKAKCGVDKVDDSNSDKMITALPGLAPSIIAENVAEVYPNPSTSSFKLYLSLANQQATNIDVLSIDGRKLQSKTVSENKGVVNIDASGYKPGVYILNIKQGDFTKTIKVIKQ